MPALITEWPELPYTEFKTTAYLLHMFVQMLGKLKLHTPFEPHWGNVTLWLTTRGLTTGLIPYQASVFSIDVDFFTQEVKCNHSNGETLRFPLNSISVADLYTQLFKTLNQMGINITINKIPQEVLHPIAFDQDTILRPFEKELVHAWLRIMQNTQCVLQRYHSRFNGESPMIGLMWGTFDLRDARYNGISVPTTGINAGYIRRNAMNEQQVEAGFWPGNEGYPRPAFFSFTYPEPKGIQHAKIQPDYAFWDKTTQEFILNYDDLRAAKDPSRDLLIFFESAYEAGTTRAGWKRELLTKGEPA